MKFYMNYKKISVIHIILVIMLIMVFSACSKKKKEEDITITLKTEGTVASQAITPQASQLPKPLPKPVEGRKAKPVLATKENAKKNREENKIVPLQEQSTTNKLPQVQEQLATNVPLPSQPSAEEIAKQEILSIINRQKQAMKTKNISLALEDIAGNINQNKKALEDYFNRYANIDVDFFNISITVQGNTATAVMNQKTSVVTKSLIPQTITELNRVQWTFIRENKKWFISGTQILSRQNTE